MGQERVTGSIVAHRNDGMGARLIAMLNAVRVARAHDLPWHVCWTTHGRTRIEVKDPTQIFDADFVRQHFSDVEMMQDAYEDLVDLSTFESSDDRAEFLSLARQGRSFLSGAAMGVTVMPWEDAADAAATLPGCLDAFVFAAPVQAMIDRIEQAFEGNKLIAYHIRRGDIIHDPIASNKAWPNKYIPREFYEAHLRKTLTDPAARVICFSDTSEEVARLQAMSDNVTSFDEILGQTDLSLGARDFLELYAMSRCQQIFGPPSSAFSQTAVTIGGGTLQAVQDALTPDEQSAAMEVMTERLEQRSALFLNDGDVGQCLPFLIDHQRAKGDPDRAGRIIRRYMEEGLDKSYAYQLLCELSVGEGDLAYTDEVREMAYARPVYVDDSIAYVNGYSAMSQLQQGNLDLARERLHTAFWFRPLESLVQGGLHLGLTAGAIDPENFYPFDPALVRRKGAVFPAGRPSLNDLNQFTPKDHPEGEPKLFHLWDIVVRDWKLLCGKRLSRAFTNKSKIAKYAQMANRAFAKWEGEPALISAQSVLNRAMGDLDTALEQQRAAVAAQPENALYRKRLSDILYEKGMEERGLRQLFAGYERSGGQICFVTELAYRLHGAKRRDESMALTQRVANMDHDFVEVYLMTGEALRRDKAHWDQALEQFDKGLTRAHGGIRLMQAKARLLMLMERTAEATALYETMVDWGVGTEYTHVQMLRLFREAGQEDLAKALTDRSAFDFEAVVELADN